MIARRANHRVLGLEVCDSSPRRCRCAHLGKGSAERNWKASKETSALFSYGGCRDTASLQKLTLRARATLAGCGER